MLSKWLMRNQSKDENPDMLSYVNLNESIRQFDVFACYASTSSIVFTTLLPRLKLCKYRHQSGLHSLDNTLNSSIQQSFSLTIIMYTQVIVITSISRLRNKIIKHDYVLKLNICPHNKVLTWCLKTCSETQRKVCVYGLCYDSEVINSTVLW